MDGWATAYPHWICTSRSKIPDSHPVHNPMARQKQRRSQMICSLLVKPRTIQGQRLDWFRTCLGGSRRRCDSWMLAALTRNRRRMVCQWVTRSGRICDVVQVPGELCLTLIPYSGCTRRRSRERIELQNSRRMRGLELKILRGNLLTAEGTAFEAQLEF